MSAYVSRIGKAILGSAAVLLLLAGHAGAGAIEFDDAFVSGGVVEYGTTGSGDTLLGIDIQIDTVKGIGTPLNSNPGDELTCTGCLLNFQTGSVSSIVSVGNTTTYTFDAGGFYTITGDVGLGSGDTTLLTGQFTEPVVVTIIAVNPDSPIVFVGGAGTDEKHSDLLDYFGVGPDWVFGNTNLSSSLVDIPPGEVDESATSPFRADLFDVDVLNTQGDTPAIPEPGTLLLLGSGLAGLRAYGRRKSRKA